MFNKNTFRLIFRYIRYLFVSGHKKGYGIHSPFVFNFISSVLNNKIHSTELQAIKQLRNHLRCSKQFISTDKFGEGSRFSTAEKNKISQVVRRSAMNSKYGHLLFNMIRNYNICSVLELGTSVGIGALYLASANKKVNLITIEGNPDLVDVARQNFSSLSAGNIEIINERFDNALIPSLNKMQHPFLILIDGDHSFEATTRYFNQILPFILSNDIIIFDDINWSNSMEQAWKYIKKHPLVTLTIDLFRLGIVFFNKNLSKQDFVIKF